jgi:hypothetical protein
MNATPSSSTVGSTAGAFLATTIVVILDHYKIDLPAGYEAGLAAFITTVGGYIPDVFKRVGVKTNE